jgi:hypothetical protein
MKFLFCGFILITASITHSSMPQPIVDLWQGIEHGDAKLVDKAISVAPGLLRARLGQYGDTPLMAAIRKYGQELSYQHEHPSRLDLKSLLAGIVCGFATSEVISYCGGAERYAYLLGFLGGIASTIYFAAKNSGHRAKVIAVLLQKESQFQARNREGLNALELLRAYHHFARELNETSWFHFHSFLQDVTRQEQ